MDLHTNILISGWLNKKKSSDFMSLFGSWNKRYFTFDGKVIKYYQNDNKENHNIFGPSGIILLRDIIKIEKEKQIPGNYFRIITNSRTYDLQALNDIDYNKWVLLLNKHKKERDIRIELLKKQVSIKAENDLKNFMQDLKKEMNKYTHKPVIPKNNITYNETSDDESDN